MLTPEHYGGFGRQLLPVTLTASRHDKRNRYYAYSVETSPDGVSFTAAAERLDKHRPQMPMSAAMDSNLMRFTVVTLKAILLFLPAVPVKISEFRSWKNDHAVRMCIVA